MSLNINLTRKKDDARQKFIEDKIDCTFIRILEDDDIFDSINKIFRFIKNKSL